MAFEPIHSYSAFAGSSRLASGLLEDVAAAARNAAAADRQDVLVFSDATGDQVDLDLRGSEAEVRARHRAAAALPQALTRRGRPKLGVISREVTLLPDQWDWLASQPGGASVTLRKLIHAARHAGTLRERMRRAQERSYKVMVALAGNQPGFEEAARALFANNLERLQETTQKWPPDVREHILQLADPDHDTLLRNPK